MAVLSNFQPEKVFEYFEEICSIPHGSFNITKISNYLVEFAKSHSLRCIQDEYGNVIIFKDASEGYEDASPVILQGHMDMVCEKESDCEIDFENDGLDIYVDGDFIKAHGTTLGGDDGIALAYTLAILDDDTLKHPGIEAVFTVNEEVGLLGADSIDMSEIKGNVLLNIDSEEEGYFLTSCAGGLSSNITLPVNRVKRNGVLMELTIEGLLGGHSGAEIHKERANANIVITRIIKALAYEVPVALISLEGGLKDNAIPREAEATFLVPEGCEQMANEVISAVAEEITMEYRVSDPDMTIVHAVTGNGEYDCLDINSLERVMFLMRNIPNGVQHMSMDIPGLVETSLNAGIMKLEANEFKLTSSVRSSVTTRKYELAERINYLCSFLGGEVTVEGDYPAWEYNANSKIREKIKEVYMYLYGEEPEFAAIHAGLECGMFAPKINNMDAISMGPDMFDIHTPKERLSISSTRRVYQFLVQLLASLK